MLGKIFASVLLLINSLLRLPMRFTKDPNMLEVYLRGEVVDEMPSFTFLQRFLPRHMISFRELVLTLRDAEKDPRIRGLILHIGDHSLGWAGVQELRQAILAFRSRGKLVFCCMEDCDNIDYMLACAADEIIMTPSGSLNLIGLASEVIYFKEVLDKLDIKPQFFQMGKYKSAVEPYTRTGPSRAMKESTNSLLDSLYGQLVSAVSEGRNLKPAEVRRLIDEGPYLAAEAHKLGMVDELLYEDQITGHIEKKMNEKPETVSIGGYRQRKGPGFSWLDPWRKIPRVALIYASGVIHSGESRNYAGVGSSVGSDTLAGSLRAVREDENVSAAVLRVDSPGGSGLASDVIWREVSLFSGVKPLIVSMGDMSASGGYYISMASDHILAQPATLTGSIGVIGGKINIRGIYDKLGLKKEINTRGKSADIYSEYTPFSPGAKKKLEQELKSFYDTFVEKAAQGRKKKPQEMERSAQGRVWTGEQALAQGLVDEMGGLRRALEVAKQRAGIRESQKTMLEILPRSRKFLPIPLFFRLPFSPRLQKLAERLEVLEKLEGARILALLPFDIKIK